MDKKSEEIFNKLYDLHDRYDEDPKHMICAEAADHIKKLSEELEKLKAAPENKALTITLPCNIGDMVYEIEDEFPIIAYRVTGFVLGKTEFEDEDDIEGRQGWQVEYGKPGIDCECPISEFGKNLFLTRKEAEQALAARKPEGSK